MNTKGKRAFITGVYGQDGSYLAELLLNQGYTVLGIARESERGNAIGNLLASYPEFTVSFTEVNDTNAVMELVDACAPHEIYNLAAVSDLKTAELYPDLTYDINFRSFHDIACAAYARNPEVRIFQALSSRVLVPDQDGVITERSVLKEGVNMYDVAKRDSYEKTILPLRSEGCFISSGFLCNHESPRRGERFVTGKIAKTAVLISKGMEEVLSIGNVEALRDWSHAKDIVSGMYAILAHDAPGDYVIGSGELHSVREFIDEAFSAVGIPLTWSGSGVSASACDAKGVVRVQVDPTFYRPDDNPVVSDTARLVGDTGWKRAYTFPALVQEMVAPEQGQAILQT